VDTGTDKVYQYIGAASRTSGSQNAGATFALGFGNTNPQGIADPPPAEMMVPVAATPVAVMQLQVAASSGLPNEVIGRSLTDRDGGLAIARVGVVGSGGPFADLVTSGSLAAYWDSPTPVTAEPVDLLAQLAQQNGQSFGSDGGGLGLLEQSNHPWAANLFSATLTDEAAAGDVT
jgi:hypothetical protein